MCINCLRTQVDISEGISKQITVQWCRGCGRYHEPPSRWLTCTLESKELLSFCLHRLKGLKKVRLVDASFVWTEPHSKRLKIKLTIQKEVLASTILEQVFVVEYVIAHLFCSDCHKVEAFGENQASWVAVTQVRQRVTHKKTFLLLEQLILKHNMHEHALSVREAPEGLDIHFAVLTHCKHFIDFLQSVVPIRFRMSKKLIGHDMNNNTYDYKWSFSVELVPICRDDLVCLPRRLSQQLGGFGPFALCHKISNLIHLIDPVNMQRKEISANTFWSNPFRPLCTKSHLVSYIVLDVEHEPIHSSHGKCHRLKVSKIITDDTSITNHSNKYRMCNVLVARDEDFGCNDKQFTVRSLLGNWIQPDHMVLGYDISTLNINEQDLDYGEDPSRAHQGMRLNLSDLPEVILIKRQFRSQRSRHRPWKLKHLTMTQDGQDSAHSRHSKNNSSTHGKDAAHLQTCTSDISNQKDYEEFLLELEEEPELRQSINLYKDSSYSKKNKAHAQLRKSHLMQTDDLYDVDQPSIHMNDQCIKDLDDLDECLDSAENDEDWPQVGMDELLDDFINMDIIPLEPCP